MSPLPVPSGKVLLGDCQKRLKELPDRSIDMVLTDPPYMVRYRSREGVTIANDDNGAWLKPVFAELYRVLKDDSYMVSFYGWQAADQFMSAWKAAGFRPVEHLVFTKSYASSVRRVKRQHEMAYLLAKGSPARQTHLRCAGLVIHRQSPASDTEASGQPSAPGRGVLPARRAGAWPLLRVGLEPGRCLKVGP